MLWLFAYFKYYVAGSMAMLGVTILMDAVLALGHGYDDITTETVVS
jgi:hypothetical protein